MHWIGNRSGPVPDAELLSLLKEVELSGAMSPPFAYNAGNCDLLCSQREESMGHFTAQQHHVAFLTASMYGCIYIGVRLLQNWWIQWCSCAC